MGAWISRGTVSMWCESGELVAKCDRMVDPLLSGVLKIVNQRQSHTFNRQTAYNASIWHTVPHTHTHTQSVLNGRSPRTARRGDCGDDAECAAQAQVFLMTRCRYTLCSTTTRRRCLCAVLKGAFASLWRRRSPMSGCRRDRRVPRCESGQRRNFIFRSRGRCRRCALSV